MATDVTLQRLRKLADIERDLLEKLTECAEERYRLLNGEEGIADRLKRFETAFDLAWGARYAAGATGQYRWDWKKDRANTKRLLRQFQDADLAARAVVYLKNDDPFFVRARHAFNLFVTTINQHVAPSAVPTAPSGCRHTPPCGSDVEHTRRSRQEMRGEA